MGKTPEQRKVEFEVAMASLRSGRRESSLPRPFKSIGNFLIRINPGNLVSGLRPENDYGDRRLSVYSGPVIGIEHIVKVVHDHKAGRLPESERAFVLAPEE